CWTASLVGKHDTMHAAPLPMHGLAQPGSRLTTYHVHHAFNACQPGAEVLADHLVWNTRQLGWGYVATDSTNYIPGNVWYRCHALRHQRDPVRASPSRSVEVPTSSRTVAVIIGVS